MRCEANSEDAAAGTGVCGEGTFLESVADASRHVAVNSKNLFSSDVQL
jgi:hypothetical protein